MYVYGRGTMLKSKAWFNVSFTAQIHHTERIRPGFDSVPMGYGPIKSFNHYAINEVSILTVNFYHTEYFESLFFSI